MKKILITGATGQIGSELTVVLRQQQGFEHVIAAGYKQVSNRAFSNAEFNISFDIREQDVLNTVVQEHQIDTIFHLASLLSAVAEDVPQQAWDINMNGLLNVLEVARINQCSVFFPSCSTT